MNSSDDIPKAACDYEPITEAFISVDSDWICTDVSPKAGELFGLAPEDLLGRHLWHEHPLQEGDPFRVACTTAMQQARSIKVRAHSRLLRRWLEYRIYALGGGLTIYFIDITQRRRIEQMDAGQHAILAGIAARRRLDESLERIVRLYETLNPEALCSLLLLDPERQTLLHGAAPSLPAAYNEALIGLPIGEAAGACGTAMWRQQRVVSVDIASDPLWQRFGDLALAHGLRACWSTPVIGSRGQVLGSFAVYYDTPRGPGAGELESVDRLLAVTAIAMESEQLTRRLLERDHFFEISNALYCIFNTRTQQIVQSNAKFSQVTGWSAEDLASRHYLEFVHPEDRSITTSAVAELDAFGKRVSEVTYRFLCADGSHRWLVWESVVGEDELAFAVGHDVTERRRVEAALAYADSHDAVTQLPHRLTFERELQALLDAGRPVWVMLVGLDRFHSINESMGHLVGDEVLRQVAIRLQATLGSRGVVARFAGDQFALALPELDRAAVTAMLEQLREAIAQPIDSDEFRLALTASIGVCSAPEHGWLTQDLLRRAEAAMTRAKRQGRDSVCHYSARQMGEVEERLTLGHRLRGAAQRGELSLHYQPQHGARCGALQGFEALLRWTDPDRGPISPARFIPIAEALGLMPEIGAWVINEACRQARVWLDQGHADLSIAVNVSVQELQRRGLVEHIDAALRVHALPARMLCIELTETSLMENVERVRGTLAGLKALGASLALDDFGTGYSSLAYLKLLPLDKLKIDQSFVRGLPDDADDAAIARTIVAMAHQLRMKVSAEGVETAAQAGFLDAIGCDELQGYLLGRPLAADEAGQRLAAAARTG